MLIPPWGYPTSVSSVLVSLGFQAIEADGFQADTEEDDEEDCVIVSTKTGELHRTNIKLLLGTVVVYYKVQI